MSADRPERGASAPLASVRGAARAVGSVRRRAVRLPGLSVASRGFPWRAATVPQGVEPLPEVVRTGTAFETSWARSEVARAARAVVVEGPMRAGVAALARPEVRGLDRLVDLRRRDPVPQAIFASNHHSHLDTPLLLTSIPLPWRHHLVVAAGADYFFRTRATGVLSALALNAIPIERTRVGRRSAELAGSLVQDGWSLLIFPEGGRSPDGWGQPFRGGAAFLAVRTGAPVVPVHIEGTGSILGKGMSRPKAGRVLITFGVPMWADEGEDARRFGVRIERAVASLRDEQATDWWTARQRAALGSSPTLEGPPVDSWRRAWALGQRRTGVRRPGRPTWPDLS